MRSQFISVGVGSTLLLASALLLSAQEQPATGVHLTKAEAVQLTNSTNAQDHRKLAAYFRNEAREAEDMAQMHEEMMSGLSGPVSGTETELVMQQSRSFVEDARKAEKSALDMAKEQEAIAQRLQQDTTATK